MQTEPFICNILGMNRYGGTETRLRSKQLTSKDNVATGYILKTTVCRYGSSPNVCNSLLRIHISHF